MVVLPTLLAAAMGLAIASEGGGDATASVASATDHVWIRHPVLAGETATQIAERHGVTAEQLRQWNPALRSGPVRRSDIVRIQVDGDAPALQPIYARVGDKMEWSDVAGRYGVEVAALRSANPRVAKRKRPPKGARLVVWVTTGVRRLPAAAPPQPMPTFVVPEGGVAVGRPHSGRLEGGVQLPDSDLYTKRFDRLCYGTTLTVREMQRAIATFRRETAFDGELFIGAMSRRHGRKLRPHRSHRTGRDVDIRMPALAFAEGAADLGRDDIDWSATWALVEAFVRTEQVHWILLERKLWSRLRRGALRAGATDEQLDRTFAKLKHADGHTSHIHVRFVCSPEATDCRD